MPQCRLLIRGTMTLLVEEIRLLEVRIAQLERELTALARQSPACTTLLSIPGVGLLTATAMVAATSGDVTHFHDARHFASWFGLTPRNTVIRHLAAIGRHAVQPPCCAPIDNGNGRRPSTPCALANKLARICYATLRDNEPYGVARLNNKVTRTAFALST